MGRFVVGVEAMMKLSAIRLGVVEQYTVRPAGAGCAGEEPRACRGEIKTAREAYNPYASLAIIKCSCLLSLFFANVAFLFDTRFFTCKVTQVVDSRSANNTDFVYFDAFNVRRIEWENTLHTYSVGNFTYRKHLCYATTFYLDNHTAEALNTLLVTLYDLVGNGYGVTAFERWNLFLSPHRVFRDSD